MAQRYYEFHFAVKDGQNFITNGILLYQTSKALTKDQLITHTREYLNTPAANVIITHITKLSRKEHDSRKNQQLPG